MAQGPPELIECHPLLNRTRAAKWLTDCLYPWSGSLQPHPYDVSAAGLTGYGAVFRCVHPGEFVQKEVAHGFLNVTLVAVPVSYNNNPTASAARIESSDLAAV